MWRKVNLKRAASPCSVVRSQPSPRRNTGINTVRRLISARNGRRRDGARISGQVQRCLGSFSSCLTHCRHQQDTTWRSPILHLQAPITEKFLLLMFNSHAPLICLHKSSGLKKFNVLVRHDERERRVQTKKEGDRNTLGQLKACYGNPIFIILVFGKFE